MYDANNSQITKSYVFVEFTNGILKKSIRWTKDLCIGYKNLEKIEISKCVFRACVVIMAEKKLDLKSNLETQKKQ